MKHLVLLCLLAIPVHAAEPPDWYAHIPAEQRAALLAMRHAAIDPAAIAAAGVHGWPGPVVAPYNAPYAAPQFDLAKIGAANLTIEEHNRQRAAVRRILRANRQPDVHKSLTVRGVTRGEWHECKQLRNEARQFR